MSIPRLPTKAEADALYERHVKPLEAGHSGEYAAVSTEGRMVLGPTLLDVVRTARAALGPGNVTFKIGEKVVTKLRSPRIVRSSRAQSMEPTA
jgi:hypothetical protein